MTALSTPTAPGPRPAPTPSELDAILREGTLRTVFQPVHEAATGRPVALEAYVRGPADSGLSTPAHLFRAAAVAGRVAELDLAAHRTALRDATSLGLAAPWTLFLNSSLEGLPPAGAPGLDAPGLDAPGVPVVVDVHARSLLTHPGAGLRLARRARAAGWGVALDGVGADLGVLALLPVLRPDVVKLDLRLLARRTAEEVATVSALVGAHAARTGARVLAQSVEDAGDHARAVALGADLVQGWAVARAARPEDVLTALPVPTTGPLPVTTTDRPTPADRLAAAARPAGADAAEQALTHLRLRARHEPDPTVLVSLGGAGARRHAADLGPVAVRAHRDLDGHGLAVLSARTASVVLARPGAGSGERTLVVSHDPDLVADLVEDVLTGERPPHRPEPPAPARTVDLTDLVADALEGDRRTGTGTGLLLVGVDGTCRRGGRDAVVRRMRRAVRSVDRWLPLAPDLFAVLLTGLPRAGSEGVVERVADALLMAVEIAVDDHPSMSVSIGASLAPQRALTGAEAHRQALAALETARGAGGHCARIWPV
ncbi:EAL domain-containing protein [Kineococcus sp. SYSU DK001]|uniref:EAL domain-containing protein n=1 Tax=Kineococcus sp. SYSU DK001 TaxID=3383122 RepID=UPI003D7CEA35